ncbi:Phytyl ester synthase 2 [Cardamine amara subsp. amara]|uniref:Phytyl ester synthase 2 n=1 Tax=Cardamine amara subsp. amara TaxID=228776 RepID=A0ABD1BDD3_CARAN
MAVTTLRITDRISPICFSSTQRLTSVAFDRLTNSKSGMSPERREDGGDCGPSRWFSPLECGARGPGSPLLLYVPGIDGTGLGLIRQHRRLGEIFDIWCLHFPVSDRTPARDLVKLIERTVRSEYYRLPNIPIYIVGESIGASLALDVAGSNPDIDLVLILANPGYPFAAMFETMLKETAAEQTSGGQLGDFFTTSVNLPTLMRIFPKDTLLWKLQLLKSASASASSHMYTVKGQTLILLSGHDQWLVNKEDIERLQYSLLKCEVRKFEGNGQFLFLEDGVDLVSIMKLTYFYRRGKSIDYISDYILPTLYELKEFEESQRLLTAIISPVYLSTLDNGTVVRSLAGIPSGGLILYVGNHMLFGTEFYPAAIHFLKERNILVRGLAHPVMFTRKINSKLQLVFNNMQLFDSVRITGAVPVSDINFYKLLRSKAHVVLYPGGVREALHRKNEEYKLFWPEHSEFVRIASKFGAKIIPFGVVGEDDLFKMVFDYNDQMKIPFLKNLIKEITQETMVLRTVKKENGEEGEVGNQDLHVPGIIPQIPGRFYIYFGKPIETEGKEKELNDKEKAHEVYLQVKSEAWLADS